VTISATGRTFQSMIGLESNHPLLLTSAGRQGIGLVPPSDLAGTRGESPPESNKRSRQVM
jgi:hypothetical protein